VGRLKESYARSRHEIEIASPSNVESWRWIMLTHPKV
jgi:hypothetical protein